LSRLTASRVRLFIALVFMTGAVGFFGGWIGLAGDADIDLANLFRIFIDWALGGSLVWGFEILIIPSRYGTSIRRLHFLAAIAVKSIIMAAVVALVTLLSRAMWKGEIDLNFLFEVEYYRTLAFVFIFISIMQIAIQVVRIVGGRTLINFVLGKYLNPVSENKIFMFLDLAGSTELAKKLGDIGVQSLITNFFFDIARPVAEHGGDIHRYVGDQVVVTWPLKDPISNLRAIECYFAIGERMEEKREKFKRKFGVVPSFRIGLHGGPVVISQCGDYKQEISYFGDTVNTAARIEQQCKILKCPLLISADLLSKISLPANLTAVSKGLVKLRGREEDTELYTVVSKHLGMQVT